MSGYIEIAEVAEARQTATPRYGMTADGYTKRSGAPSSFMIRLQGDKLWRRVMVWQFANRSIYHPAGTCFVRIRGQERIISDATAAQIAAMVLEV